MTVRLHFEMDAHSCVSEEILHPSGAMDPRNLASIHHFAQRHYAYVPTYHIILSGVMILVRVFTFLDVRRYYPPATRFWE